METETRKGLQVKIFIGTAINSVLRHHLQNNPKWEQAKLALSDSQKTSLIQVTFEKEQYIGRYTPSNALTVKELQNIHQDISKCLKVLCPEVDAKEYKIQLFPQIFIA